MSPNITFDCLSLFPSMMEGFLSCSIIGRACKNGLISVNTHNIRDWATDKHHITDDEPFGGGAGMVMKPEPIFAAIEAVKADDSVVIFMCPDGELLTTEMAKSFAQKKHIILLSGHYEGIDERIRESVVDYEVSIGDYVLTNGTLASAVFIDAVSRHVNGVLGESKSLEQDSFSDGLLSFPQYTRPADFRGMSVPAVLMSGNHGEIEKWRNDQRMKRTLDRRPDLLEKISK